MMLRAASAAICAMIVSPSLSNSRPNRRLSPERTKRDKRRAENMLSNTGDPPLLNCRLKKAFNQGRSEEHTSELQSLMRISYAVFCLKKTTKYREDEQHNNSSNKND